MTTPLNMLIRVYVAEKEKKQMPSKDVVMPREDKCSPRRFSENPKEEKAVTDVARRAVRKTGERRRRRADGRSRLFSSTDLRDLMRGRESIPVVRIPAPQIQKGRRNPENS